MTVPTTRLAYETGFATEDIGAIRVLGERVEDVVVQDFERLRVVSNIGQVGPLPSFIAARIRDSLVPKPAPDRDLCTRCGVCVETCPAVPKALSLTDRGIVIDYAKCIRCYCCQEMCPAGAMKLRSGLLAKLINR
jgi:ferredoxin